MQSVESCSVVWIPLTNVQPCWKNKDHRLVLPKYILRANHPTNQDLFLPLRTWNITGLCERGKEKALVKMSSAERSETTILNFLGQVEIFGELSKIEKIEFQIINWQKYILVFHNNFIHNSSTPRILGILNRFGISWLFLPWKSI